MTTIRRIALAGMLILYSGMPAQPFQFVKGNHPSYAGSPADSAGGMKHSTDETSCLTMLSGTCAGLRSHFQYFGMVPQVQSRVFETDHALLASTCESSSPISFPYRVAAERAPPSIASA